MAQNLEGHLAERYPYRQTGHWLGLYSRYPILHCQAFRLDQGQGQWAQHCVLDIDGYPVSFLNVHPRAPPLRLYRPFGSLLGIPIGFHNQARDADVRDVLQRIGEIESPLVVIGDLNLTDQQTLYAQLMCRLRDVHRESGWGMGFTFTRFPRLGLAMWRIDYVLYSPDLVALETTLGDYGGSDHRTLTARLARNGSR
jgi:endonuclease/exonuclease/phosphatase family metal-dependent hydrolase